MITKLLKLPVTLYKFSTISGKSIFNKKDRQSIFKALVLSYIHSLLFPQKKGPVMIKMIGFNVHAYNYRSFYNLVMEVFAHNTYYFKTKNPTPFIIDCGANIGFATLFFKKLYPESSIYCFEPNPMAFVMLQKNIQENQLKNITCHNCALSDRKGSVSFYVSDFPGDVAASLNRNRGGAQKLEVTCDMLSSFVTTQVDALKLDVEGAEVTVIDELNQRGLLQKINVFLIEYHHLIENEVSNFGYFLSRFEENGFDYNIATGIQQLRSFQDIYVCCYKRDGNIV
jgi:FkbM family methyltransferase